MYEAIDNIFVIFKLIEKLEVNLISFKTVEIKLDRWFLQIKNGVKNIRCSETVNLRSQILLEEILF